MKGGEFRAAGTQFLNLFENGFANVFIGATAGDDHHKGDRHACDEQNNAQNPELPPSLCSGLGHGRLPGALLDATSIGSSSMRRRGFVSWNQGGVRSLT